MACSIHSPHVIKSIGHISNGVPGDQIHIDKIVDDSATSDNDDWAKNDIAKYAT